MYVAVISASGKPLMPTTPARARKKLKAGLAKVVRRSPFTIKLLYETKTAYTQEVTLGCDVGSGTVGFAAVGGDGKVYTAVQTELRNDVSSTITVRANYRKARRNRKTRYRKPRFLNRASSSRKGRLSPTVKSKTDSITNIIGKIGKYLPVTKVVLEVGKFDPNLMENPELADPKIGSWGYRHGPQYGYQNIRMAVKARDKYRCYKCKKGIGTVRLEVHHIIPRSLGGSNCPNNLITLCEDCHRRLHDGEFCIMPKNLNSLAGATQMNVISSQLRKRFPDAEITYGYITAVNRWNLGYGKETHWLDAVVIATGGRPFETPDCVYYEKCVAKGNYRRTQGRHSEKRFHNGRVMGIKAGDKVRYRGRDCFVKGLMLPAYAKLKNIHGTEISFSYLPHGRQTPKLAEMKRLSARRSRMITMMRANNDSEQKEENVMSENQNTEYMQTWEDEHLKLICGFANASGGKMFVGCDAGGNVVGLTGDVKKLAEEISGKIGDTMGIGAGVTVLEKDGKEYIEIDVTHHSDGVCCDGGFYYHGFKTNRLLTGCNLKTFLFRTCGQAFDGQTSSYYTLDDIDDSAVEYFKNLAAKTGRLNPEVLNAPEDVLLEKLGLMNGQELTQAAMLLFGKDPDRCQCGSYVKIGFFESNTELVYQDEVHGPVIEQIEKAVDLVYSKYLKPKTTYEGTVRCERYFVPREAFREALINAVCHNCYEAGASVQVGVYDDRLYIGNAAFFPGDFDVESALLEHYSAPYNPKIANVLWAAGFTENKGLGLGKISAACNADGVCQPTYFVRSWEFTLEFTATEDGVMRTVLKNTAETKAGRLDSLSQS